MSKNKTEKSGIVTQILPPFNCGSNFHNKKFQCHSCITSISTQGVNDLSLDFVFNLLRAKYPMRQE